jgi:hypothetical protein
MATEEPTKWCDYCQAEVPAGEGFAHANASPHRRGAAAALDTGRAGGEVLAIVKPTAPSRWTDQMPVVDFALMNRSAGRGLLIKTVLTVAAVWVMACAAAPQVPAKDLFSIHITKVKRVDDGCTAEADSAKVRFKISADLSGSCAMLRAGETYTAFRGTVGSDPPDRTKDTVMLVVYDNSGPRNAAGFRIDSEESIARK